MAAPSDPKARLDRALAKQRRLQKEAFRQRRERGGESSVIRTFVAWVRGEAPDYTEPEDPEVVRQQQRAASRRTMGILVLITAMLALIVFLLMVVALKVARQS